MSTESGIRVFLVLAGLALLSSCSSGIFTRHYRGWYLESMTVSKTTASVGEVVEIRVDIDGDLDPHGIYLGIEPSADITVSAGQLSLNEFEADEELFGRDFIFNATNISPLYLHLPDTPQEVTVTGVLKDTKTVVINVVE